MDPVSGISGGGPYLPASPELLRQRPHQLYRWQYSNWFLMKVNISDKSSSEKFYVNTINYTSQASGRAFTQFTTPYTGNYIVIFMTSLWIAGTFGKPLKFHVYP